MTRKAIIPNLFFVFISSKLFCIPQFGLASSFMACSYSHPTLCTPINSNLFIILWASILALYQATMSAESINSRFRKGWRDWSYWLCQWVYCQFSTVATDVIVFSLRLSWYICNDHPESAWFVILVLNNYSEELQQTIPSLRLPWIFFQIAAYSRYEFVNCHFRHLVLSFHKGSFKKQIALMIAICHLSATLMSGQYFFRRDPFELDALALF